MEYVLYNTYQIQVAVSEKLNCSIWLNDIILEEKHCLLCEKYCGVYPSFTTEGQVIQSFVGIFEP